MNRWIFILLFLTLPFNMKAQHLTDTIRNFTIQWAGLKTIPTQSGDLVDVPSFENALYKEDFNYLPFFQLAHQSPLVDSISLVNPFYESLGMVENLSMLEKVTHKLQYTIQTRTTRFRKSSNISLLPFRYDSLTDSYLKLKHFDLVVFCQNEKTTDRTARKLSEASSSVLVDGSWYRMGVTKDGIYKVDYQMLSDLGISLAQLDPRKIGVYGNGGKMLPQANSKPRPIDLVENAISVIGEDDGSFDQEDYILFYGQGPDLHGYEKETGHWQYQNNVYSDTTYYFLTIGDNDGLRIDQRASIEGVFPSVSTCEYFWHHETEEVNILANTTHRGSGRDWYGERFGDGLSLQTDINALAENSTITLVADVLNHSFSDTEYQIAINGHSLGSSAIEARPQGTYALAGTPLQDTLNVSEPQISGGPLVLALSGGQNNLFLNYLIVKAQRKLLADNRQQIFWLNEPEQENKTVLIENMQANWSLWDVSDPHNPFIQEYLLQNNTASFSIDHQRPQKFILFSENDLKPPQILGAIENQDLRGDLSPEMVIITHPLFKAAAERLAQFRASNDQLSVKVVGIQKVYNEFSSGSQDVSAIRDYMRYLYEAGSGRLKYLLLFGKSSYDYKSILERKNRGENTNFVPTYQSRNSLHPIFSYASDDYYGFLDEEEGSWIENSGGDHTMDIGVGRIPVTSSQQAQAVVDKLINYEANTAKVFGQWRKDIYFIAEDGDFNIHQRDADKLASYVDDNYADFNVNKIYLDAYPQEILPNTTKAPVVNQLINETINKGALIVNYTGHGSESQLAKKDVLNLVMINNWDNQHKLPLFVTATCEFGRHDDPTIQSGAELLLAKGNGGAIGLVTTSRPVYSNTNFLINRAFYESVFELSGEEVPSLGSIFQHTKNNSLNGSVNRNFSLLGDPSMQLAYPEKSIVVNSIESLRKEGQVDTLKALEKVRVQGKVIDLTGSIISDFNGQLSATVYDKPQKKFTLGNQGPVMTFNQRENVIFRGIATVEEGQFSFDFIVPKNIDYTNGDGKISLYAFNQTMTTDAGGASSSKVGGSIMIPQEDDTPPRITIFMEDTVFQSGDLVSNNPVLMVKIFDQHGVNISSEGIGQEIMASLINQETQEQKTYNLNDFYSASLNTYQSGWVNYRLQDLAKGTYYLNVKAWDTFNNLGESAITFLVGDRDQVFIKDLLTYPNPFTESTTITAGHNKAGNPLQTRVQIYSARGELVLERSIKTNENSANVTLEWDGMNAHGQKLESGVYVIKLFIRSLQDGSHNFVTKKIILIN